MPLSFAGEGHVVCRVSASLQRDGTAGACVSACAALCALLGVDRILFAFGDSSYGTFVDTCAASNTIITNYVSHSLYLLFS